MSLNPLRNLPSVGDLLESPPLKTLVHRISHNAVTNAIRAVLEETQTEAKNAVSERTLPNVADLAERIVRRVVESETPLLRPVVNATGVLLPTGLGHAPLADEAILEMAAAARDYASAACDLANGKPRRRSATVENLLRELIGTEAALVVHGNAEAALLTFTALAAGREVVVGRGQMIEIDDGFRLPETVAAAGATVREVGTTNKTHLDDYVRAIGSSTAMLLAVHASRFFVEGGIEGVSLHALTELGRKQKIPVVYEVDSGAFIDFTPWGLLGEPTVSDLIAQGADAVLFSGGKLLGGPSCGIIAGKRAVLEQIMNHPFARAFEADKITLAALAATLRLYRDPAKAKNAVPLLRLLDTPVENLRNRAERLTPQLAAIKSIVQSADVVEEKSTLGDVTIPSQTLRTFGVMIAPAGMSVERFAAALRNPSWTEKDLPLSLQDADLTDRLAEAESHGKKTTVPVLGRIVGERFFLDLRSVFPRQDAAILAAVEALA